jgi:FkbH-like protein
LKRKLLGRLSYARRTRLTRNIFEANHLPDYFVAEVLNPGEASVRLTLSIKAHVEGRVRLFQKLLAVPAGFVRARIQFREMVSVLEGATSFEIELVPNDAENVTLLFGLLDFVKERPATPSEVSREMERPVKCKCVVWDLDNTIWHGTLIEDGIDALRLRAGVADVIKVLDERGILQSVASKNLADDAMAALASFGLEQYFLYPQVSWGPKSQSIRAVARALNIDESTFVFVDDQQFERDEVRATLPGVTVLDVSEVASLLDRPALQVPVTDESRRRRSMYRDQQRRVMVEASYGGDYLRFLRDNDMKVFVTQLSSSNMSRVFELAQRTNQMNFSGNRYSLDELRELAASTSRETFVIRCVDRFGDYGIVGFAVMDVGDRRLLDLMFSCRVQAKRVEHGFLAWLIGRYREREGSDFFADYRRTNKNQASGAVFSELGFVQEGLAGGVSVLRFACEKPLPNETVVTVLTE